MSDRVVVQPWLDSEWWLRVCENVDRDLWVEIFVKPEDDEDDPDDVSGLEYMPYGDWHPCSIDDPRGRWAPADQWDDDNGLDGTLGQAVLLRLKGSREEAEE